MYPLAHPLRTSPLSNYWRNGNMNCTAPFVYILGMAGYALSLPSRVMGLVLDTILLIVRFVYALCTCQWRQFIEGVIVFFSSVAEIGVAIIGIICPPIAYSLDEHLYKYPVVRNHSLSFKIFSSREERRMLDEHFEGDEAAHLLGGDAAVGGEARANQLTIKSMRPHYAKAQELILEVCPQPAIDVDLLEDQAPPSQSETLVLDGTAQANDIIRQAAFFCYLTSQDEKVTAFPFEGTSKLQLLKHWQELKTYRWGDKKTLDRDVISALIRKNKPEKNLPESSHLEEYAQVLNNFVDSLGKIANEFAATHKQADGALMNFVYTGRVPVS